MSAQLALQIGAPRATSSAELWRIRVREALRERYAGRDVTTDHAWRLVESVPGLACPVHVSPKALGSLFYGWDHARPVMLETEDGKIQKTRKSVRPKAKGNELRVWRIDG